MMQRDTLKKFYLVHSWVGVITAILMFVICFSGAVSVFGSPDLKLWTNPSLHRAVEIDPVKIDALIESYGADIPAEYFHEVHVFLPGARAFGDLGLLFSTDHGPDEQLISLTFDPHTLELKQRREGSPATVFDGGVMDMEEFITHFHANLHLGQLGLILTGLLGLTLMASIVSGVIIHRKILKELFVFRPLRSLRLLLTDSHKVISVWGLLFHAMIGFTGAFLGLATVILLPAAAFVSFEGDQELLLETFQPERMPVLSGESIDMQIDKVLDHSMNLGGKTVALTIMGWGDKNALAYTTTLGGEVMPTQTHAYNLDDGSYISGDSAFALVGGVSGPILDVMFPLHFGNFGGLPVRILWALLGIGTAMLAVTGAMIWVEKRAYGSEGKLKPETYLRLSKVTIGSCSGMVVACAALFWIQRLLPGFVMSGFFIIWFFCLGYALSLRNNYQSNRHLLMMVGILLMGVPFVDALTIEHHLFNSAVGSHTPLAIIEVTLLLLGVATLTIARKLPVTRPEEKHRQKRVGVDQNKKLEDAESSAADRYVAANSDGIHKTEADLHTP